MSVVTIAEVWPAAGRPFTVADLDRIPDDGRRYELLDGALIVSPRPTTVHQVVAGRLCSVLSSACPEGLCVAYERIGVPWYWIVNPDPPQPELTVFELGGDGGYAPRRANARAFHRRPPLRRDHRPGPPGRRTAPLNRAAGPGGSLQSRHRQDGIREDEGHGDGGA